MSLAAVDSGSPYAQLGSSRLRSFGAFNEPTVIFVTFVLALTTHTDLPYAFGATIRSSTVEVVRPSHLLMIAAFFMLVLNETGRIPVESHGGTLEFGQIEEARVAEHSGPGLAFLRWGSSIKQLLLYTIFMNVLVVPWGLAGSGRLDVVALAIGLLFCKALGVGAAVVVIESSFAKLRLYKIPEFTVGELHVRGAGGRDLPVRALLRRSCSSACSARSRRSPRSSCCCWSSACCDPRTSGSSCGSMRSVRRWWPRWRSRTAATGHGSSELYVLAAVTIALKALLFPLGIRFVLRRLEAEARVPSVIGAPSAILIAIALCALAFIVLRPVHIGAEAALPLSALPVAVGGVLVAFLLMVLRPYAPSQLLGFLVLENAVSVASLVIAPGLPIILALLLLFDVLLACWCSSCWSSTWRSQRTAVRTDVLNRLTG